MAWAPSKQEGNEAIASLLKIFPDVSVEVLRHYLDSADGNLETATNFILESYQQLKEAPPRTKLPGGLHTQTHTEKPEKTTHTIPVSGDSIEKSDSFFEGLTVGIGGIALAAATIGVVQRVSRTTTSTQEDNSSSRLASAIIKNTKSELEKALREGANPNVCITVNYPKLWGGQQTGVPVLTYAAGIGYEDVVTLLLNAKANPEFKGDYRVPPIHRAIAKGHIVIVKKLLDHGALVKTKDSLTGYEPLHYAAIFGFVNIAKVLKEYGSNLEARTFHGSTPLHKAASNGKREISEWLVQEGADVTTLNKMGKTAAAMAETCGHKDLALWLQDCRTNTASTGAHTPQVGISNHNRKCNNCKGPVCGFRYMCLTCKDYDLCGKCEHETIHTHHAMVRKPSPQYQVKNIVVKCQIIAFDPTFVHVGVSCDGCASNVIGYRYKCMDCKDYNLCQTCEKARKHIGHVFVRLPPNITQSSSRLISAIKENKQLDVAQALREGANPNICIDANYSEWWGGQCKHVPVLTFAVGKSGYDDVITLLLDAKADPEFKGDFRVPALHRAIAEGHIIIVRKLLAYGAIVKTMDSKTGYEPLHYAAIFGFVNIAKVLQEKGCNLEAKDNSGNTPLHSAAFNGKRAVLEWLVEEGVNVTSCNDDGKTAIALAESRGHKDIAVWLQDCRIPLRGGLAEDNMNIQDSDTRDINHSGVQINLNGGGSIIYKN